jgi:hypothetical protein
MGVLRLPLPLQRLLHGSFTAATTTTTAITRELYGYLHHYYFWPADGSFAANSTIIAPGR